MGDLRAQIIEDIKEQLDFILQNENNITDFSVVGKEIGIDDMDGYMISGYIPIEGASADLFYSIDIKEDSFRIDFIPPALPLTQDLLERIDVFNSNSKYNTEYLERYITVHTDEYKLNENDVVFDIVELIFEVINDSTFMNFIFPYLKFYKCPQCGNNVELDYPYDADDYVYHCHSCGSDYSIEEITGITNYIDEYK